MQNLLEIWCQFAMYGSTQVYHDLELEKNALESNLPPPTGVFDTVFDHSRVSLTSCNDSIESVWCLIWDGSIIPE